MKKKATEEIRKSRADRRVTGFFADPKVTDSIGLPTRRPVDSSLWPSPRDLTLGVAERQGESSP
ncbi:hypothetical protein NPIL_570861, partial [Nephila pilipes]